MDFELGTERVKRGVRNRGAEGLLLFRAFYALWIRMDQDIKGVEEGDHDDVGTDPFLPMV